MPKQPQQNLPTTATNILAPPQAKYSLHMGQFAQFGLNGFKRGQKHYSQLHISLDPDKLESLITVMRGFAKVTCMGCDD